MFAKNFSNIFLLPLDRQRKHLKFKCLFKKSSHYSITDFFTTLTKIPSTNQLGQFFEKGQKIFNPLTNQLLNFQSDLVEIFKAKQKSRQTTSKKMSYDD